MLFAAIARPVAMIDDPMYSGWATHRYGPDAVTSRDLLRWPAAQIRSDSPTTATRLPHNNVDPVGCASHNTMMPEKNPSGTRHRARRRVGLCTTSFCGAQSTLDRGKHLFDLDSEQAHL